MMKKFFFFLLYLMIVSNILAQKKAEEKYQEISKLYKDEIWGWKKPEFNITEISNEYLKYSSVVIARHQEIIADSRFHFHHRELKFRTIIREAIKINDKSALSYYSEISFNKLEKRIGSFRSTKMTNYVGVRVKKNDGKEIEINADDIVNINNTSQKVESKIAIPNLEVGDILEYFIAREVSTVDMNLNEEGMYNHTFFFYDEIPILSYSVHFDIGKKYAVEYRCYNNSPDFKISESSDGGIVMDLNKKKLLITKEDGLWASPFRQLPIVRLRMIPKTSKMVYMNHRKTGEIYKNQNLDEFVKDRMYRHAFFVHHGPSSYKFPVLDSFLNILYTNSKKLSKDSLIGQLYYAFRFGTLFTIYGNERIEAVINRLRVNFNDDEYLEELSRFMGFKKVESSLVLTSSRYGPLLKEVLDDSFGSVLKIDGQDVPLLGYEDVFSPAFYIPSYYENTKQAIVIEKNYSYVVTDFTKGSVNIGGTDAKDNSRVENLRVTTNLEGGSLQLNRHTTLKGHYKSDVQKKLITFEEYYEDERKQFGIDKTLVDFLKLNKKTQNFANELDIAQKQEREKQKDRFTNEARGWFEQEVTDLSNPKLHNLGTRHYKPDFVYSASFKMGGLVKKAGNNFIIDIGKLQGSPLTLTEAQRKRTIDVYMPFARSVETTITFTIPDGFSAEGVAALNKKVENETGYFITEATVTGNQLVIAIKKSYNHAFEPAANWDKLLAFIDAANEFTNAKILLKKK